MKLVLLAEAEDELTDAAAWYDERRDGLGDELIRVVFEGLTVILEAPEAWRRWPDAPARIPPIRRFVLPQFPYAVAYQAHAERVVVLALVHGKRRPLYWIGRSGWRRSRESAAFRSRSARSFLVRNARRRSPRMSGSHIAAS